MLRARSLPKVQRVGPGFCCCPAFPDLGVPGTQAWGVCVLAPVPLERLLLGQASSSSARLHSCCSDYISIKTLLTTQAGCCIPLQVTGLPCSAEGPSWAGGQEFLFLCSLETFWRGRVLGPVQSPCRPPLGWWH